MSDIPNLIEQTLLTQEEFWSVRDYLQDGFVGSWLAVVGQVKDLPNVVGYDLLNEPMGYGIMLAIQAFGLSSRELRNIIIYGFKRSFYPGSYIEKRTYVRRIIDFYEEVENVA